MSDRVSALVEGPAALVPERIVPGMALRGRRVVINSGDGDWVRDARAADDPYMYDEAVNLRWLPGSPVPADADVDRARLYVAAVREADWYEWARTKRRPQVVEYPAYLVWAEGSTAASA